MIVDLRYVNSVPDMVAQLSPIFYLKPRTIEHVSFNFRTGMLYPEYLLLIVAAFNWAKENDISLVIDDIYQTRPNYYPCRINFYRLLGYNYNAPFFNRWSNKGKFIEITPLQFDTIKKLNISSSVVDNIVDIFKNNFCVEKSIYSSLNYCLWEQIDNIQNHSGEKGTGYIVAQNFPLNREIRICVADTGMGIYKSLTRANSQYQNLLYKEAIQKCIEEHVTNGNGKGNGLYHSSRFVLENCGEFILYSGKYYITIRNGVIHSVQSRTFWQGTIIFQKIKTDNPVDYNKVFNNCDVPTSVDECDDMLNALWE